MGISPDLSPRTTGATRSFDWVVQVVLGAGCVFSVLVAQAAGQRTAPVAIAIAESSLFVLESGGAISMATALEGQFSRELYRVSPPFQVTDVAAAVTATGPTAWFVVNRQLGNHFQSWVIRVAATQRERWTMLPQNGIFGGVAADGRAGALYVSNSDTNEVFMVPMDESKPIRYVATILSESRIAALATDWRQQRLLIGDGKGVIYALQLGTGKSSPLARCPRTEIRGLAVDADGKRLYVADSDGDRVWAVNLGGGKDTPCTAFAKPEEFREPTGIAVDSQAGVWVADKRAKKLFRIAIDRKEPLRSVDW